MTQITSRHSKDGIELIPGCSKAMPSLWLIGEPNSEVKEEQKEVLFNTGFVRYIDIHGEANLRIIPPEITKVLKKLVKEYPYSLGTYIIAPGNYSLIRI